MKQRAWLALVLVSLVGSAGAQEVESAKQRLARENADRSVIAALQRGGADLNKPHDIEHFFIARTRDALIPLTSALADRGFSPQPPSESKDQRGAAVWTLLAVKPTVPSEANIFADTEQLAKMAKEFGVIYDGWGAKAVK